MRRRELLTGAAALAAYGGLGGQTEAITPRMKVLLGGGSLGTFVVAPSFAAVHTVKPWSQGSNDLTNATTQINMVAEGPFNAFYLLFRNPNNFSETITRASVAMAYGIDVDGVTPLNAGGIGDNTLWQILPDLAGMVIPAGTGAGSPNFVSGVARCPRQAIPSVVRLDGDLKPWCLVRIFSARISGHGTPALKTGWPGVDLTRHWSTYTIFADKVTTPAGGVWTLNDFSAVYAGQFEMASPGISYAQIGDSVDQGYQGDGTTTDHNSAGHVGCAAISTQALPVSYGNFGEAGTNSANWVKRAQALVPFLAPGTILGYPTYTPNDAFDAAHLQIAFQEALSIARLCAKYGVKPALRTPQPWSLAGSNLAIQEAYLAQVRAMSSQGLDVIDYWATLNDPNNDGTILAAYAAPDGHHPNEAGQAALGAAPIDTYLNSVIAKIVSANKADTTYRSADNATVTADAS